MASGEALCLTSSIHVLPLDVTIPHDSYAWNYRELATLVTLTESLAEGGFEPLIIQSHHGATLILHQGEAIAKEPGRANIVWILH